METMSTSDWSMAFVLKDYFLDSWVYLHNVLQSCGGKESPAQFPNYIFLHSITQYFLTGFLSMVFMKS